MNPAKGPTVPKRFLACALLLFVTSGAAAAGLGASAQGSTPSGIAAVVSANNQTAFDLYAQLQKSQQGNIFYSPYSISTALAMVYEGARGATASEMQKALHFPNRSVLEPNCAAIHAGLNNENASYRLETGNAMWIQKGFPVLATYKSALQRYFAAKASNLDFRADPEKARTTINKYIAAQTAGKIQNLIPAGYVRQLTVLVLTNAIYFKGEWRWQFDRKKTQPGVFTISPGKTVKTAMMHMGKTSRLRYADLDGMQMLELPYKGGRLSMVVLLPHKNLQSVASALTAPRLQADLARMRSTQLSEISIPKFELTIRYDLKSTLEAMGMRVAFSDSADLSGIDGKPDLYVRFVVHKAYVKVDEHGTEAAGATAVGIEPTAAHPPLVFRADHPFIFLIRDRKTGNILFLGRVVDPTRS
jgi:serine protease inhibitor